MSRLLKIVAAVPLAFGLCASGLFADVKVHPLFADHMVLQRGRPLPIWGTADPDETVAVTLDSATGTAVADAQGNWTVRLAPLAASDQPRSLVIAGKNTVVLNDVLVGDVWLCSGQSNMVFKLRDAHNADLAIAKANQPKLRLFTVAQRMSPFPEKNCEGTWQVCTPETAKDFSAVAYFFGSDILIDQQVPIGLINSSRGGSPSQAWTSFEALEKTEAGRDGVNQVRRLRENYAAMKEMHEKHQLPAWRAMHKKWEDEVGVPFRQSLKQWMTQAEEARRTGKAIPPRPKPARPEPPEPIPAYANWWTSTLLYNSMIAPLIPFSVKGVIWYQGEANAAAAVQYQELFPALINDWRERWAYPDMPFLWVQLAGFQSQQADPTPWSDGWAGAREAQSMALKLPHTGQAVAIDIGEGADVHPKNKLDVGKRLALVARHVAYGQSIVYSGPVHTSMTVENDTIRISFDHTGGGLTIGSRPPIRLAEKPAKPAHRLKGFAIAGSDRIFHWAQARIDGKTIVVSSPNVKEPVAVRYAWANNPDCNLYNAEGLPASPFRTDNWANPEPSKTKK